MRSCSIMKIVALCEDTYETRLYYWLRVYGMIDMRTKSIFVSLIIRTIIIMSIDI